MAFLLRNRPFKSFLDVCRKLIHATRLLMVTGILEPGEDRGLKRNKALFRLFRVLNEASILAIRLLKSFCNVLAVLTGVQKMQSSDMEPFSKAGILAWSDKVFTSLAALLSARSFATR